MKTVHPHSKFFIIGNADEQNTIEHLINKDDVVIRFNNPNPSCSLKANWVFIANGTIQIRHLKIEQKFFNPNTQIFFRYSLNDILTSKYEIIPLNKKIKYYWRFPRWKKNCNLDQYPVRIIPDHIHFQCMDLLHSKFPSTGLLAIYYVLQYYPKHKIILHNFTNQGWSGHNWDREKLLIQTWEKEKRIDIV
ncbi:MAG: hypothetical protein J6578_09475 [Snodgrassella sp.]|uniref:hypothetical protein n=1 Tax=Snodgrassella sp. TaxID=2815304 RepID=UPI00258A063F|nr:hypothetical protein [Snodgrassella sp.]MCO6508998.1 hypothetical protein [Snodgrassella sp.]